MDLQDAINFQPTMLDKVSSLKNEYNQVQGDVLVGKGIIDAQNLKSEVLEVKKNELLNKNLNSYLEKTDTVTGAISFHRNSINEAINKSKHPMMNGKSDQEKVIGQMQYEAALSLAQSNNYPFLLNELQHRYRLGQIDFVSKFIETMFPNDIVIDGEQYLLFNEAKKIRSEIEKKFNVDTLKIRLDVYDVGLSRSQRLLNGLKSGAYQIFAIEDFREWGSVKGAEMLKWIETTFNGEQASKIKQAMYQKA